jgi:lysophospholipase L1-like esterase
MPGNYVQIYNVGDPTYGAALNGAVTRVLSTPTPQQFTVSATFAGQTMPDGDYSAGFGGQPWLVASMVQTSDAGWLQWLNLYMKGNFMVVANYAQGGTRSDVGVKLLPKIRSGPKAEYAIIQYCTNDVNAGTVDPSGCLANIQQLVTAVEALGMVPIVSTPTAIGDPQAQPSNPASAQKNTALQAIVQGEHLLARNDPALVLFDTYALTIDSSSAIGGFLPNYAPVDGLHPSSFGEVKLARTLSTQLTTTVPVTDLFPTTSTDWATANIVQNGLMAGTNGRVGSAANNEVTGSVPTGWSISTSGGTATTPISLAVSGNNSHSNVPGNTLDVTVTTAGAGTHFQLGTNAPNGSSFGGRIVAGSWYRCGFQVDALTALSNFNVSGQVFLNYGSGSTWSIYFMNQDSRYDNGMPLDSGESLQFVSAPFYVPTQPAAGGFLFINGSFSGALAGQKFSLSRVFCATVASPYD